MEYMHNAQEEWNACSKFSLRHVNTWTGICDVKAFSYQRSSIDPVGESYDVFDDGTVQLVHTPGHTRGMFSVSIRGTSGCLALGSDVAYLPESFSGHIIPSFTVNNGLAEKSPDSIYGMRRAELFQYFQTFLRFFEKISEWMGKD